MDVGIAQWSHPLGLGLGNLCHIRVPSVILQQSRVGGKKRSLQQLLFRRSNCLLPWASVWDAPLHSPWNGHVALPLSSNQHIRRLSLQNQNRIVASNSSSFPESSGVGEHEDQLQNGSDRNGKPTNSNTQGLPLDGFSGGWESEQDRIEAEFAASDHGVSNGVSSASSEDARDDSRVELWERLSSSMDSSLSTSSPQAMSVSSPSKEPVFEVIEVNQSGQALKKLVSRRQLLRTSGLRLRDLRRVDPSLWVTNSAPALLVREEAVLLNLGSLRAIATTQEVLIFDHQSVGSQALMEILIPRLNDRNFVSGPSMPFALEVIESALMSRTQRLERALMDVEPRVLSLLEVLPTRMTADVLEELRVCKQALVEVGAKAGALRQMLLELLEHPQDIRRMVIMGHVCHLCRDGNVACDFPQDKDVAEDEEEEMEMLLEYYLQRCESCHGQALKLLSSAKEMEDSIAVNLSSRRLEVSRLELLLQVGTFCAALGALIAGIFGMNLKSYLEERALAFWCVTGGIILGGIALFFYMFSYLSNRKIL